MRKVQNPTARIKKFISSMAVLLVFLFPLAVSLRWMRDVVYGNDPRSVYAPQEVAAFSEDCQQTTGEAKPFDEPLVTITFDDGWESIYSEGFEVLETHCIKSTQYVLGGHFEDPLYLSENQISSMQSAGHEIASHSMTHPDLTKLSETDLKWEVGEADRILSEKFGPMREFATPLGASNDKVLEHLKKYYRSHRNTVGDPATVGDEDINVRETFNPYNINAYTISKDTTPEDIHKLIEYTKTRNGWLILTYHQVDDSDGYYAVNRQTLSNHLRIIRESQVRTPTMGQVLDAHEERN